MLVVRGRGDTVADDRAVNRRLLELAADGRPSVRAWCPPRQVAFGRRDRRAEGYQTAREAAHEQGFPPVERDVGGRAVAYTGRTVAFGRAVPAEGRGGIDRRYDRTTRALGRALRRVGVDAREGEPDGSFCPGTHSLRARGKLVGIAQRVRRRAAVTAGVVIVDDRTAIADVLAPVYDALGVEFRRDAVGSVARAGGTADPDAVARAVESELVEGWDGENDGGTADPEEIAAETLLED